MDEFTERLAGLADQAPRLTEEVRRIARRFGTTEFEGTSAEGRITAVVTGLGELTEVRIGETARRQLDNLSLGDAVAEAIRTAEATAKASLRDQMAGLVLGGRSLAEFLPAEFTPAGTVPDRD